MNRVEGVNIQFSLHNLHERWVQHTKKGEKKKINKLITYNK